MSGAERRVAGIVGSWTGEWHLPGLAWFDVNVPTPRGTVQVDALVHTPHGVIVVEVKGLTRPQSGALVIPPNGSWTIGGQPAAIHTLSTGNPFDQLRTAVYAVKNAFQDVPGGGGSFITGVVALVALPGSAVTWDRVPTGGGLRVVEGTATGLRRVLHGLREGPVVWTADGVLASLSTLNLPDPPTRDELRTEGFPEVLPPTTPRPARTGGGGPRRRRPVRRRPVPDTPTPPWTRRPGVPTPPTRSAPPVVPVASPGRRAVPGPVRREVTASAGSRSWRGPVAVLVVFLGVAVWLARFVHQAFHG